MSALGEPTKAHQLTGVSKLLDRLLRPARERFESTGRSSAPIATAASLSAGAIIMVTGYLLVNNFRDAYVSIQFATTNERLLKHLLGDGDTADALSFSLQHAQQSQWRGMIFSAIWGLIGASLFHVFWRRCWHVGPAINPVVLKLIAALPLAGATFAIVEKIVSLIGLTSSGQMVELRDGFGPVIVSLAWAKWVLAGTTILAVLAMIVSSLTGAMQRSLRPEATFPPAEDPPRERGTGVCCSGGGIRAAGFTLGALSALERWPAAAETSGPVTRVQDSVLGSANYLASVSGGGYAASAWRIAAGTDKQRFAEMPPLIGDPTRLAIKPGSRGAPTNLVEHVRKYRSFLATGRGGLPLATIRYVLQTMFHMTLLLGFVYLLMWPFGMLLRSWAVGGLEITKIPKANDTMKFTLGDHQWVPPLAWLGAAIVPWLLRLGMEPGLGRRRLDAVISFFAVLAVASAFVLIALPWLVVNINLPDAGGQQIALTGIYATAVTALWQVAKRYLERQAKYLGGVFLAAGLALFGLRAIEDAALDEGWLGKPITYIVVVTGVLLAFVLANPDKWSLNDFYRKRLAGTFVTTLDDNFYPSVLGEDEAPRLADYAGAPGPEPVVCCAASREVETETGVAALSMTLEPAVVTVHSWRENADDTSTETTAMPMSQVEYNRRLPHGKQGDRLASLIGAAAISGAAVAPSMGRLNMSTTNALLAAFNARLGVWVPNPAHSSLERMAAPRLVNMFKEIFGIYGATDPNVYATDGGHWENLGLVELVRKQCSLIISIDTSGNPPGTYLAFKNAIALAFLECDAEIEITDATWKQMVPDEDTLVPRNFARGIIKYADGTKGELLYVKAAVSRTTPLAIQRYAAGDPTFPNYSTANQMLSDAQLTNLVKLGFASMNTALQVRADEIAEEAKKVDA